MNISEDEGWNWGMIRTGMSTVSSIFVVQMQDLLGKDNAARMNLPSTIGTNWRWRMQEGEFTKEIKDKIEETLQYPGTIKVVVIRETRAEEVAK